MNVNKLSLLILGIIISCGSTLAEAAITSETRTLSGDVNARSTEIPEMLRSTTIVPGSSPHPGLRTVAVLSVAPARQ